MMATRHSALGRWAIRFLWGVALLSLCSDFIANERPLYCRIDGQSYYPVLRQYGVSLGLANWEGWMLQEPWQEREYERVVFAPIPYSAGTIDHRNTRFVGPFDEQRIRSKRFRHWLGTDHLGRDVAAGLIGGARTALLVGLVSMAIAGLIGIFLGGFAGYLGDHRMRLPLSTILLNALGGYLGLFYGFIGRQYQLAQAGEEGRTVVALLAGAAILLGVLVGVNILAWGLARLFPRQPKVRIPADLLVMRLIEIMNSIPALFLILSVAAIISRPSIFYIMVIIGLLSWTGIARFVRAEMLRIRELEYIKAAEVLGYGQWRILLRHALPNALTPVLITLAFGAAGAILSEATLSFLGIGVAPEEVTWGSMLSEARQNFSAWWLAIFPGLAIFLTVTSLNLLGDRLNKTLDPRLRK